MSKAYLLTWNSQRWPWTDLPAAAQRLRAGQPVTSRWGCGRNTQIQTGDRLFLLKQGAEPRGLMASGRAMSAVYQAPHWDAEKAQVGVPANYVDIQFDILLSPEEALLRRDFLKGHPTLHQQHWDTQVSGIAVKTAVLSTLETIWRDFNAGSSAGSG